MNTPFCRHLRTKKMYIEATPHEAFADQEAEYASPCQFWCNLTQTVVGPDDKLVHKGNCKDSRQCFEE